MWFSLIKGLPGVFRGSAIFLLLGFYAASGVAFCLAAGGGQSGKKIMPPLPLEEEKARTLIREVYSADFSAKGAEKQRALADKLLDQVAGAEDTVTRYVLLCEAVKASSRGGDLSTAFETIDRIDGAWMVNVFDLKSEALTGFTLSKKASLFEKEVMVEACRELITAGIEGDRYRDVQAAIEAALKKADKLGDKKFKSELKEKKVWVAMLVEAFDALRPHFLRLLDSPEDSAGNLAVGSFYVEKKKDPGAGVPFLVMAPSSKYYKACLADVAAATGRGAPFDAGEAWSGLYLNGKKKQPEFRDRALYWYQTALAKSSRLERGRVQLRIQNIRGDIQDLLRPLKLREFSALVWKDASTGWQPVQFSSLRPARKSGTLVLRNPSDHMFGYLVCDFDAGSDFYLKFTVKGANAVGMLRSSGRSPGGDELVLRGGAATIVIERVKGEISYRLGRKTVPTRRFGYYYYGYGSGYGGSTRSERDDEDDGRSSSASRDRGWTQGQIFIRLPRRKIVYLSSVKFYQEAKAEISGSNTSDSNTSGSGSQRSRSKDAGRRDSNSPLKLED